VPAGKRDKDGNFPAGIHHGNHLVLSFCKFGKILLSFHLLHLLVEFALFDLQNLLQLLIV